MRESSFDLPLKLAQRVTFFSLFVALCLVLPLHDHISPPKIESTNLGIGFANTLHLFFIIEPK